MARIQGIRLMSDSKNTRIRLIFDGKNTRNKVNV